MSNGLLSPRSATDLGDASVSINPSNNGASSWTLPTATLSAARAITIGTSGSPLAKTMIQIVREDLTSFSLTVINGGPGGGTLYTFIGSISNPQAATFQFDGTNWKLIASYVVQGATISAPLTGNGSVATPLTVLPATESTPGYMSAADKTKLDNITSGVSWAQGVTRTYAVSYDHGNDTNLGFSDVDSADAGLVAVKTLTQLQKIRPQNVAGLNVRFLIETRAGGAMYLDPLGDPDFTNFLQGMSGYGDVEVRATSTDATASSVAFANDGNDVALAGAVVAAGTNTAGYNPTGTPTASGFSLQQVGGAPAALPAQNSSDYSGISGKRFRFFSTTTTSALRNQWRFVYTNTTGAVTFNDAFGVAPTTADIGRFEEAGVQVAQLITNVGANTLSVNGIKGSSEATQIDNQLSAPMDLSFHSSVGAQINSPTNIQALLTGPLGLVGGYTLQSGSLVVGDVDCGGDGVIEGGVAIANGRLTVHSSDLFTSVPTGSNLSSGSFIIGNLGVSTRARTRVTQTTSSANASVEFYTSAIVQGLSVNGVGSTTAAVKLFGNGLAFSFDDVVGTADTYGIDTDDTLYGSEIKMAYFTPNTVTGSLGDVAIEGAFPHSFFPYQDIRDIYGNHWSGNEDNQFSYPSYHGVSANGSALGAFSIVKQAATPFSFTAAKADSSANATSLLGVTLGPTTGTGAETLIVTAGPTYVKFDAANPAVPSVAYISDVNFAHARAGAPVSPAVAVPIGIVLGVHPVDNTLGLVRLDLRAQGNPYNILHDLRVDGNTTVAGYLTTAALAARATPSTGHADVYVDSTSKNLAVKSDDGVVKHGVQTLGSSANQFVNAIDDDGTVHTGTVISTVHTSSPITGDGSSGTPVTIAAATDSTAGYMSAADKTKLDGIGKTVTSHQFLTAIDPTVGTTMSAQPSASDVSGLAAVATSGAASDISGLAAIATSGSGSDLTAASVTNAKLANMAATTLKGNNTGGSTAPTDLTFVQVTAALIAASESLQGMMSAADKTKLDGITSGANTVNGITSLTGDVTASGPGAAAATIAAGAVTNSKLANMAATTLKGNSTGGSAAPTDLTFTQVTANLNAATESLQGMLSAADKTKLDGLASTSVSSLSAVAPETVSASTGAVTVSNTTYHQSVTAVATANITLSGTQTIDGIAVVAGNRVLCAGQSTASQNGVYVVAAGAWSYATDWATGNVVTSTQVSVDQGTANAQSTWIVSTTGAITVGTTAVALVQDAVTATQIIAKINNSGLDVTFNPSGGVNLRGGGGSGGSLVVGSGGANSCLMTSLRFQLNKDADVASASTLTLGSLGNYFHVTGTTGISFITTTAWQSGSEITLYFASGLTLTHNASSPPGNTAPMLLAGSTNFTAAAGARIKFVYDSALAAWLEVSRVTP